MRKGGTLLLSKAAYNATDLDLGILSSRVTVRLIEGFLKQVRAVKTRHRSFSTDFAVKVGG